MRRLAFLLLLVAVAVPIAPARAQEAAVRARIVDFELTPGQITVSAGSSVTWTNEGARPHTVTDRGGLFDTDAILPGNDATVKLDVPGTYEIFCQINPSRMNAKLVVTPGAAPPAEVRVQAFDEARTGETKRFDPAQLEVASGTRVILANVGGLRHSLKADDGAFAIAAVDPGDENGRFAGHNDSVVVDKVGTHTFFCEIHPAAMKGTLVVTGDEVVAKERTARARERPPPTATVTAAEFAFVKTETLIASSGTVTWTNRGSLPHTATFDDVTVDTGRIAPGQSAELTAPGQPGSYSYRCTIHPRMRGVLIVSPERVQAVNAAASGAIAGDDAAGTVFAWLVAVAVVGVGAVGLFLGLRRS